MWHWLATLTRILKRDAQPRLTEPNPGAAWEAADRQAAQDRLRDLAQRRQPEHRSDWPDQ